MSSLRVAVLILAMPMLVLAQAELKYPLAQGTYRFEGKCLEFRDSISDQLNYCDNRLGIDMSDPKHPNFLFLTKDGKAWVFWTERVRKVADDGRHAEFRIKNFTDLGVGSSYDFAGECLLDFSELVHLECRVRMGRKVVRTAIFESHGTFLYSRDPGEVPAASIPQ